MIRAVLAVIAGYVAWSVLWLLGGLGLAAVFSDSYAAVQEGGDVDSVGYLGSALVLSVVCSFCAGLLCAVIARGRARGAALWTAALLLLTGIGVQASAWSRMPLWYHLAFLVLLVPVVLAGARRRRAPA